jgi:hypothetical protein
MAAPDPARVCLVSLRGVNRLAGWCSNYEFEDVISQIDNVDLLPMEGGRAFRSREWVVKRLIWRPGLRRAVPHLNPGLKPIRLEKDYDLFAYVCMNPSDLIYLSGVSGWKERCRVKVVYMVEFYGGWLKEYEHHLKLLHDFDHVCLCFGGSVETVQKLIGRPCHHVPLGADVLRFTPFPNPPARSVDVYSMGRRSEPAHRALLEMARRGQAFYIYDTIPGLLLQPRDHNQHRDLVANLAKRSRFFITFPAKVDCADETRGQSEVGARFFEGAAAGSIMVGQAPSAPAFARDFPWPDAVVDLGATEEDLRSILAAWNADPERASLVHRRNALQALRRFDWAHRWQEMLRHAGLQPSPRGRAREKQLLELAAAAEATPLVA